MKCVEIWRNTGGEGGPLDSIFCGTSIILAVSSVEDACDVWAVLSVVAVIKSFILCRIVCVRSDSGDRSDPFTEVLWVL